MTERGADPWSGIPDDLRGKVEEVMHRVWADCVHSPADMAWGWDDETTAAEAALCAALRALVADAESFRALKDALSELPSWFRATPRGAQEDAE